MQKSSAQLTMQAFENYVSEASSSDASLSKVNRKFIVTKQSRNHLNYLIFSDMSIQPTQDILLKMHYIFGNEHFLLSQLQSSTVQPNLFIATKVQKSV